MIRHLNCSLIIAGTVTIMGKLTSVSGVSLLKTKKQQKYTNQEKLQLADTAAKKRVIDEGMGVRGFCQNLVNYIKMFIFSKDFGSRTISKKNLSPAPMKVIFG